MCNCGNKRQALNGVKANLPLVSNLPLRAKQSLRSEPLLRVEGPEGSKESLGKFRAG
jgi:hypothetical protein